MACFIADLFLDILWRMFAKNYVFLVISNSHAYRAFVLDLNALTTGPTSGATLVVALIKYNVFCGCYIHSRYKVFSCIYLNVLLNLVLFKCLDIFLLFLCYVKVTKYKNIRNQNNLGANYANQNANARNSNYTRQIRKS
jgi:hypothetical protein